MAFGFVAAGAAPASAETRTLKLYYLHTGEKAEITFKRNGVYDQNGLRKLNQFLRDWRRNEPTKMDPRLFDVVWETYRAVGGRDYINVVSAYRSPATNKMLRSRSKGVAEKSQHMLGKAMDFFIPGVSLKKVRDTGLKMQMGGVGYYPKSGSPFVHLDVGNVRHWPGISRKELASIFPNGNTLHVPSDGKPLPGYQQALASYKARKDKGVTALALASTGSSKPSRSGGLLSALFGGGADAEEDGAESAAPVVKRKAVKEKAPAVAAQPAPAEVVPFEPAQPEPPVAQTPEAIIAALPARSIPLPVFAPRPKAEVGAVAVAASTTTTTTDIPADSPFGVAEAIAEADEPEDALLAMNVPLPTWRPDYSPAKPAEEPEMLMAMAAPVNAPRSVMIGGPIPEPRPDVEGPRETVLPAAAPAVMSRESLIEAEIKDNNARLAMLAPASPKTALANSPKGSNPVAVIASGVRTTGKSARPVAAKEADRKATVVAAQPNAARWAMQSDAYVAPANPEPTAEEIARALVRSAPREVIASGFQQGSTVADASRFTGKAVSFMPVARFTN